MKNYKRIFVLAAANLLGMSLTAQNVGVGTTTPTERMHVHAGTVFSSATRYTNDATGIGFGAGMKVGIQYQAGNLNNQYAYLDVQGGVPFYIWQASNPRLHMDGNGFFGIRTKPINPFSLAINGPVIIFPGNNQPAFLGLADTIAGNDMGVGISMEKRNWLSSKHLLVFSLHQTKAQAIIEANFFNGGVNNKIPQIILDSNGRVGMGESIGSKDVLSDLHLFGNQRLEGTSLDKLLLHSPANDLFSGSKIRFFYTPSQKLSTDPSDFSTGYFAGLNDGNGNTDEARAFAIGKTFIPFFGTGEFPGFVHNMNNQVGIRRYPESAASNNIKIDMMGNTRITASKFTINRESSDPATSTSIELRNADAYRYGFGYDVSNDRFFLYEGKSNSNALLINNNRVGLAGRVPTTNALEINGNASKSTAGDWLANSDARLKKDIIPIEGALQKIQLLQGITYKWNDDQTGINRPAETQMGFTAQNIQEVFPQLVSKDAQGYLQTGYGTYDALYVEAIKELIKKIEGLEEKIKLMEKN